MASANNRIIVFGTLLVILGFTSSAFGAGLFLTPRGVRPLSRGGAFVAGADDLNALSYNPAGIALSQNEILLDFGFPIHFTEFTRSDTDGDGKPEPTVEGTGLGIPSPTIGIVGDFNLVQGLRFASGVAADYPLLQNWPDSLPDGSPAPQRYAIQNYNGTTISKFYVGAAYAFDGWLAVGMTAQALVGNFVATMTASNCSGGPLCVQPENPDFDAAIQMASDFLVIPGIQVGVTIVPVEWLKLGVAWESGYTVNADADIRVRLPSAAIFDDAVLNPKDPRGVIRMEFPWILRAGIEGNWDKWLKSEVAFVYEAWSVHDKIDVDVTGVSVENVSGIDDYSLASVPIERHLKDTWSIRWGTEFTPMIGEERDLTLRFGLAYEPSAVPNQYLTPMAVDLDKTIIGLGGEYQFEKFSIEATYALVLMPNTEVTDGLVRQTNATRPPFEERTAIGNGSYTSNAHVVGVGVHFEYDAFFR